MKTGRRIDSRDRVRRRRFASSRPSTDAPVVVEDWEDDSPLSEWSGSTGDVTIQTGTVHNGSNAAQFGDGATGFIEIDSLAGNGLGAYPQKGDIFKLYVRVTSATAGNNRIKYGAADTDNCYHIEVDYGNDRFRLLKDVSGSVDTVFGSVTGVGFSTDTWYEVELTWDDGSLGGTEDDMTVSLADMSSDTGLGSATGNDSDYASEGGVIASAWVGNAGEDKFVDYWHITNR